MPKDVLKAVLRVLAGTILLLALAATVGIPASRRGPAAAQPDDQTQAGAHSSQKTPPAASMSR